MKKSKLHFEEQAYSEAADVLYSRAADCEDETMSNSYIKIADRLSHKSDCLFKKLRLQALIKMQKIN